MATNSKENWLQESEVHLACDALQARDARVTTNSVYAELGGRGSFKTITKHMKTWKEKNDEPLQNKDLLALIDGTEEILPEVIRELGDKVIQAFWNSAKNAADAELNAERSALRDAEKEFQKELNEVISFSDQQAETIEDLRALNNELSARIEFALTAEKEANRRADLLEGQLIGLRALLTDKEKMAA